MALSTAFVQNNYWSCVPLEDLIRFGLRLCSEDHNDWERIPGFHRAASCPMEALSFVIFHDDKSFCRAVKEIFYSIRERRSNNRMMNDDLQHPEYEPPEDSEYHEWVRAQYLESEQYREAGRTYAWNLEFAWGADAVEPMEIED